MSSLLSMTTELAQVPTRTMSILIGKTRMSLQVVPPFEFLPSLLLQTTLITVVKSDTHH